MVYKLINATTGEEHVCKAVEVDGFDYFLGEEISLYMENLSVNEYYIEHTQIKPNRYSLFKMDDSQETIENSWKIIATNNPDIEIPKIIIDNELGRAMLYNKQFVSEFNPSKDQYAAGIVNGWRQSQDANPFSKKDMISFGEFCHKDANSVDRVKTFEQLYYVWFNKQPHIIYFN